MQFLRSISVTKESEYLSSGERMEAGQMQARLAASRASSRAAASIYVKRKGARVDSLRNRSGELRGRRTAREIRSLRAALRSYATPHVHAYNLARAYWVFCCKRLDSPGLILMTYEVKPNDQAAPPSYSPGPPLVNAAARGLPPRISCCAAAANRIISPWESSQSFGFV